MGLFRRSVVPAAETLARSHTGERAMSAAPLRPEGLTHDAYVKSGADRAKDTVAGWAIATRHFLVIEAGGRVLTRPWCDVDRATLDPATVDLTVHWADGTPTSVLGLADDKDPTFARTLYERVQSSVVIAEVVRLANGEQVRVAVRRGARDELFSQVIGSGRIDLQDPETAAAIGGAEARVRDASGLPR